MDIVLRARNIVTTPRSEWPVIAAEPPDIAGLSGYVAILAAIPLVAELISLIVMGIPIGGAIAVAVIWSVAFLIDVAVLAGVSSMLAPRFGGVDNLAQGFKLAAYSLTPFWLGGVFLLVYWVDIAQIALTLKGTETVAIGAASTV